LGTIFRTAAWYGIGSVVLSENSVDAYNPKVLRSSMGSFFHLNILQNISADKLTDYAEKNNIPVYAADLKGENPLKFNPAEKYILCFGSESHGVPEPILTRAGKILSIPKFGKGESLNLAISTGIMLNSLINRVKL
jgi:TrmH family RNA methyltransferase